MDDKKPATQRRLRIWGLPEHWQEYLCCLVLHIVAPVLPLALERVLSGRIRDESVLLWLAMYAIAIGITSASKLLLACTMMVGFFYSAAYGWSAAGMRATEAFGGVVTAAWWVALFIGGVHALERFNRHVADRNPFWEFGGARRGVAGAAIASVPTEHGQLQP